MKRVDTTFNEGRYYAQTEEGTESASGKVIRPKYTSTHIDPTPHAKVEETTYDPLKGEISRKKGPLGRRKVETYSPQEDIEDIKSIVEALMQKAQVIDFAQAKLKKLQQDTGGIKRVPIKDVDWSKVKPAPTKHLEGGRTATQLKESTISSKYGEPTKVYKYDPKQQEVGVYKEGEGGHFSAEKKIPAHAGREEELKNASMKDDLAKTREGRKYVQANAVARAVGDDNPMSQYYDERALQSRKGKRFPEGITMNPKKVTEYRQTNKSFDDRTAEYILKCHSHVLEGETEDGLKNKKKEAPKADGHTLGSDPKDIRAEGEMVEAKEPDAYKSIAVKENKKGKGKQVIYQESGEDLSPFLNRPNTHVQNIGRQGQLVGVSTTTREGKTYHEGFKRSEESDLVKSIEALIEKATGNPFDRSHQPPLPEFPGDKGYLSPEAQERNKKMHEGIKPKVPEGVAPTSREEVDRAMRLIRMRYPTAKSIDERTVDLVKAHQYGGKHKKDTPEEERAEWARDPEGEKREHGKKSFDEQTINLEKGKFADPEKERSEAEHHQKQMYPKQSQRPEKEWLKEHAARGTGKVKQIQEDAKHVGEIAGDSPEVSKWYKERAYKRKSLDERTIDLVKSNEDHELVKGGKMAARAVFNTINRKDLTPQMYERAIDVGHKADQKYGNVASNFMQLVKEREREKNKSILATWQNDSAFITKGTMIGPGNQTLNLVKDDNKSLHDTDKEQEKVMSGEVERRRIAAKKVAALKEPGTE